MKDRRHGTRAKYVAEKCRCLRCRMANARYSSSNLALRRQAFRTRHVGGGLWVVMPVDGGEVLLRTRDREEARRFRDERNREWRRHLDRDPFWAPPALLRGVQGHLRNLAARGVGYRRVAQLTGMSRTYIQEMARGERNRKDRPKRIRVRFVTAQKILGVMTIAAAAGARVPADETWRLIGELRAAGLTKTRIAHGIGLVRPAIQFRGTTVLKRTEERIRALHDELLTTSPAMRAACRCDGSRAAHAA